MAEVVLKAVTGKEVGGKRLAEGASLGLLHPNTVETRDSSQDRQGHCGSLFLTILYIYILLYI